MKFRIARHTEDLERLKNFYMLVPGMQVLGGFQDHDGYDGIFLGLKDADWHLEFTVGHGKPKHIPDEDDLLVFYPSSKLEFEQAIVAFTNHGIASSQPKNPYWQINGIQFLDPDGFGMIVARHSGD
jgi:hypothetical protein